MKQKSPAVLLLALCVQRQAAAVRVLLGFFRLGILAFEIGERHVQRFVTEAGSVGAEPWLNFRMADQPRNERDSLRSNDHGNQIVDLVAEFRRIPASLLDASNCAREEMGRSLMRDSFRQSSPRERVDNGFQISLK